jgi:hypothetical protein
MGTLVFVCPTSEEEVSTGIEMDLATFARLRTQPVRCPHCLQVHLLRLLAAWIVQDDNANDTNKAA